MGLGCWNFIWLYGLVHVPRDPWIDKFINCTIYCWMTRNNTSLRGMSPSRIRRLMLFKVFSIILHYVKMRGPLNKSIWTELNWKRKIALLWTKTILFYFSKWMHDVTLVLLLALNASLLIKLVVWFQVCIDGSQAVPVSMVV